MNFAYYQSSSKAHSSLRSLLQQLGTEKISLAASVSAVEAGLKEDSDRLQSIIQEIRELKVSIDELKGRQLQVIHGKAQLQVRSCSYRLSLLCMQSYTLQSIYVSAHCMYHEFLKTVTFFKNQIFLLRFLLKKTGSVGGSNRRETLLTT